MFREIIIADQERGTGRYVEGLEQTGITEELINKGLLKKVGDKYKRANPGRRRVVPKATKPATPKAAKLAPTTLAPPERNRQYSRHKGGMNYAMKARV